MINESNIIAIPIQSSNGGFTKKPTQLPFGTKEKMKGMRLGGKIYPSKRTIVTRCARECEVRDRERYDRD